MFPVCFQERIFAVFMMCTAACVFGLILGELQEIYVAANSKTRAMEDHLESVISFLQENHVPGETQQRVKSWIRFQHPQIVREEQLHRIMDSLPQQLRRDFACIINKNLFSKVYLWSRISNLRNQRDHFTAELLIQMHSMFYLAGALIASHKDHADKLMIIVSGSVRVIMAGAPWTTEEGAATHLLTIGPGMSIGDNSILGDCRWGGMYGVEADFVAHENCKICCVDCGHIRAVVSATGSYATIRRLFERLRHPQGARELEAASEAKLLEKLLAQPGQSALLLRHLAVARTTFHWIRVARMALHAEISSAASPPPPARGQAAPGVSAPE